MKELLKKTLTYFSLTLLSILLLTSCNNTDGDVSTSKSYSGQEIFEGIFFWHGNFANHIEVLKPGVEQLNLGMTPEAEVELSNFRKAIINQVKTIDPNYFSTLKKQLQSDNLYEVELALVNAQKMFDEAGRHTIYSEQFKLLSEIKKKNVNTNDERFQNLDLTKAEDAETFAQIFKEDYNIDLERAYTPAGRGQCFAVAVVAVIAGNIALVVNVAGAWNAAVAANFTYTSNYSIPRFSTTDAVSKALVSELAEAIN